MSPKSRMSAKSPNSHPTPPRHPPSEVLLMFEPSYLAQGCLAAAYARLVPRVQRTSLPARTAQTTQAIPTLDQLERKPVAAVATPVSELISVAEPGEFGGTQP